MNEISKIDLKQYKEIVVLTGAGISVASGLETYRGNDSKKNNIEQLAHIDRFQDNPLAVWEVFNSLREKSIAAKPNKIHRLLADIESKIQGEFTIITQNVDRLHHRGGSNNVVELHGRIDITCCSNSECKLQPYFDDKVYLAEAPICPLCNSPLRPSVTLFGEFVPLDCEWQAKKALRNCDLFVAIGTSGTVFPAVNYVRSAEYVGARTIFVNLEPIDPPNPYFKEEYIGKAEDILPKLFHF